MIPAGKMKVRDAVAVLPDGRMIEQPGAPLSHGRQRIIRAVNQGIVAGSARTPAFARLPPHEQELVGLYVANCCWWNATAPRFTVDGRRFA